MHVIVCIKQVPDTTNVKINPETNTLMRDGVESILNPFDEYALEQALRLKDAHNARVTVITMGPPQASVVLQDAIARGADDGYLLSDRAFAGADTLATSYSIAQAIKKIDDKADLVLFGKQAIDGDTAQVGPGVSEHLGYSLITYVRKIEVNGDRFRAETVHEDGVDIYEGKLPCVMTILKEADAPRYPSLSGWIKAKHTTTQVWGAKDINAVPERIGLNGSPTKVVRIFSPSVRGCDLKCNWKADKAKATEAIINAFKKVEIAK